MSEVDELKKSVQKEIEQCDEFLNTAKNIIDLVPAVQERKHEAEVKNLTIKQMPEDVLEECAPKLLPLQQQDQRKLESSLPKLPQISGFKVSAFASTSGSAFYETTVMITNSQGGSPDWFKPVSQAYDLLAQDRLRKASIPASLERLQQNLGTLFQMASESVIKSKNGVLGVDQAAIRMRDVIQQAWGGIAELSRQRCPNTFQNQRLALEKSSHRNMVAQCLSAQQEEKTFIALLDGLSSLHNELSVMCKQPLTNDIPKLSALNTRWLLQIEDLLRLMGLN